MTSNVQRIPYRISRLSLIADGTKRLMACSLGAVLVVLSALTVGQVIASAHQIKTDGDNFRSQWSEMKKNEEPPVTEGDSLPWTAYGYDVRKLQGGN